jgi:uncharacterized protein YegL
MSDRSKGEVGEILDGALQDGNLSQDSHSLIYGNITDNIIVGSGGQDIESISSAEVTLISLLIDESSSIDFSGLTKEVIDGVNTIIDSLKGTKKKDSIKMSIWAFNSDVRVINGFIGIEDIEKFGNDYNPGGATSLYDVSFEAMSANLVYAQDLIDNGVSVQSIVAVITDGEDVGSKRSISDVAKVSKDLLKTERFVNAYVGVGDGSDHENVSKQMGFPAFLKSDATPSEMRKLMKMLSQSIVKNSTTVIGGSSNNSFFT